MGVEKKKQREAIHSQLRELQRRGTILAAERNVPLDQIPVKDIASEQDRDWTPVRKEEGVYKRTIVAGTFDRLHAGHKALLARAFTVNNHPEGEVVIGVTSDEYLAAKKPGHAITPFSERMKGVEEFVNTQFPAHRFTVKSFGDVKGTSTDFSNPNNDSVAVTVETLAAAHRGNRKRAELGLPPADIFITPFAKSQSGRRISSTAIRAGELDATGQTLKDVTPAATSSDVERYTLGALPLDGLSLGDPESWIELGMAFHRGRAGEKAATCFEKAVQNDPRPEGYLQRILPPGKKTALPLERYGYVAPSIPRNLPDDQMICVGDVVAGNALAAGYTPKIIVYDGVTRRDEEGVQSHVKRIGDYDATDVVLPNPPGYINNRFFTEMRKALDRPGATRIRIIGEEDLLALAAAKEAPDGAVLLYGKPREGVVVINQGEGARTVAKKRLDHKEFAPASTARNTT